MQRSWPAGRPDHLLLSSLPQLCQQLLVESCIKGLGYRNHRFWHAPIWPKYLSESPFRLSSNTSRSSAWARESSFAMLSPWLLMIGTQWSNPSISLKTKRISSTYTGQSWGWPTPGRYSYLNWSTITPILQYEIVTNGAAASFMSRWNVTRSFLKLWTWNLRLGMKGGTDEMRYMSVSSDTFFTS